MSIEEPPLRHSAVMYANETAKQYAMYGQNSSVPAASETTAHTP